MVHMQHDIPGSIHRRLSNSTYYRTQSVSSKECGRMRNYTDLFRIPLERDEFSLKR